MRLLFDESLSPKLVLLLHDLFPESESALRNGLARAWSQQTAISNAWLGASPTPRSSFSVPATIQLILRLRSFGEMQSESLSCPVPRTVRSLSTGSFPRRVKGDCRFSGSGEAVIRTAAPPPDRDSPPAPPARFQKTAQCTPTPGCPPRPPTAAPPSADS